MKICILGDSVSKGVLLDPEQGRYICGRSGFADRLDRLENIEVENFSVSGALYQRGCVWRSATAQKLEGRTGCCWSSGNDCAFSLEEMPPTRRGSICPTPNGGVSWRTMPD